MGFKRSHFSSPCRAGAEGAAGPTGDRPRAAIMIIASIYFVWESVWARAPEMFVFDANIFIYLTLARARRFRPIRILEIVRLTRNHANCPSHRSHFSFHLYAHNSGRRFRRNRLPLGRLSAFVRVNGAALPPPPKCSPRFRAAVSCEYLMQFVTAEGVAAAKMRKCGKTKH